MSVRVKKLLKIIGKETTKTNSELGKALGVTRGSVARYLRKLKDSGVIECSTKRYRFGVSPKYRWLVIRIVRSTIGISESKIGG